LVSVWALDPVQVAPLVLYAAAFAKRAHTLKTRKRPIAPRRQACIYAGIAVVFVALASPLDAGRRFDGHMAQHLLLGDIAPLLIVLGLDGRILRPVLAFRAVRSLRVLAHPLVALPLWALNLCAWHTPGLYGAALHHDLVHALEHGMFFTCGALMWAAIVEPLPGPRWFGTAWKAVYVLAVRTVGAALASVFIWAGHPVYSFYTVSDQTIAGALMFTEGAVVTLLAFAWLFLRWTREAELRQSLLDAGTEPALAERAGRYGRSPLDATPGTVPPVARTLLAPSGETRLTPPG
jgi:putative membrane protein